MNFNQVLKQLIMEEAYIPSADINFDTVEKDWWSQIPVKVDGKFKSGPTQRFKTLDAAKKAVKEAGVKLGTVRDEEAIREYTKKRNQQMKNKGYGADDEYDKWKDEGRPDRTPKTIDRNRERKVDTNHYYGKGKLWPTGD